MKFEDHFSVLAKTYSLYRPAYPAELFSYFADQCSEHKVAWDCGTGNGQAAVALAEYFKKVIATDGSKEQIENAIKHPRITYLVETAEDFSAEPSSIDMLTAAAAAHWFNFDRFYQKVRNVLKPGGIVTFWGYNRMNINPEIDSIIDKYIHEILEGFWPERFQFVKSAYKTLPFPFKEFTPPQFQMTTVWNLDQVIGFLNSWSGTRNYFTKTGKHPVEIIWNELLKAWGEKTTTYTVSIPLFMRIGRI